MRDVVILTMIALLGGCSGREEEGLEDQTLDPAAAQPARAKAADAQESADEVSLPSTRVDPGLPIGRVEAAVAGEGLLVSTNEPFWQVRVELKRVVLDGVDAPRRLLVPVAAASIDRAWHVVARDGAGSVELDVSDQPCQDTMSGANFPYSAVLAVDGGVPVNGCARPASMPMPGEGS